MQNFEFLFLKDFLNTTELEWWKGYCHQLVWFLLIPCLVKQQLLVWTAAEEKNKTQKWIGGVMLFEKVDYAYNTVAGVKWEYSKPFTVY